MHESLLRFPSIKPLHDMDIVSALRAALIQAATPDPVESAASFGRWWLDTQSGQLVLSAGAAAFLDVEQGSRPVPSSGIQGLSSTEDYVDRVCRLFHELTPLRRCWGAQYRHS